jgi:PAS domain S-box-containing protein
VRILVADDDPTLSFLIRVTLEGRGHEVISAENGRQVLDLVAADVPDIVLLDVMMPELDGFQTLSALRADESFHDLPIVLLSARVGQEDRQRGMDAGASGYVTKPFDPDSLGEFVEHLQDAGDSLALEPSQDDAPAPEVETSSSAAPGVAATLFNVLDLAVDAIVSVDTSQYIVAFNKGAEAVFGYLAEEVLGKPLDILLPERAAHLHARHVERFATGPDPARLMGQRQEIFGRRKDGSEFPAEASIAKIEMDGRLILTAILRDVTSQRQAEKALRTRARQHAAIAKIGQDALGGAPVSVVIDNAAALMADVLDVDAACILKCHGEELEFASGAGLLDNAIGTALAERSAHTLVDFTMQQDEPVVIDDFDHEYRFEVHPLLRDGALVSGMTVTVKSSVSVFGVMGVFTTRRRRFDDDDSHFLQAVANTLAGAITRERSEDRLRTFLESAPDATIVVNSDGQMVSVNEQTETLFGYSRKELLTMSVDELVPSQIRGDHASYRKQFHREPRTRPMGAGLNLLARRKDGTEVPVDILLRPLETDEGSLVVAAVRDVTDRRRSEQVRDAFLHAVSHDLRTPLTGVVGFSSLLVKPDAQQSEETVRKYAGLIYDGAKKLETLLENLLDLDRLSRGVIEPHRRETDLVALVESVAATLPLSQNELTVEISDDARIVRVDPAQVERIIENLLVNITRHCPAGTSIWVSARRGPNGVLLCVEDGGPGVPDALKTELFQPFRRGDHQAASPGSGIGLSLVARFAELHGGRAWVEDRIGGGASFRVLLGEGAVPSSAAARDT